MAQQPSSNSARWDVIKGFAPDAIFALNDRANAASEPKANLVIGAYRDEQGLPHPLKSIRSAERHLLDMNVDYEYLPMAGFRPFVEAAVALVYGDVVSMEDLVAVQTISGTGAVSLGAKLLTHVCDQATTPVYLSNPTWPNHFSIFEGAGWKDIRTYRYYDPATVALDFEGMKEDILAAPEGSIFVLHQCAHNPTGVDPTHEQWNLIGDLMLQKGHQVFFDSAYQGYASGSLDADAYAARCFAKKGLALLVAQSFSKNMGLYSERTGTLSLICRNHAKKADVKTVMEFLIRQGYSSPPAHGARVAHLVLTNPDLRKAWEEELAFMSQRIREMRTIVHEELLRLETPGSWDHVINQIGMFSFLGLTKEQSKYCQDHNVFITLTGRANMAGLTTETALLLARVVSDAVRSA